MAKEYEIAMLWVKGPLSFVEQLCAKSFVDAGQHVKLYHYGPLENVPEGVEVADGNEVLPIDNFIQHGRTGSFALFSDVFRYHLLRRNDRVIWADTDAYCLRPFTSQTGHFYGWESERHINGGVLGLPSDSDALAALLEMTEDEYGIPEWYPDSEKSRLGALAEAGTPEHVSEMDWGVWGPHAITHYLHKTGEARHALPVHMLYPMGFADRRKMMRAAGATKIANMVRPDSYSIHFYGRRMKRFIANHGGRPEPGSFLDGLIRKHGIDMEAAPVPNIPLPAAAKPAARAAQEREKTVRSAAARADTAAAKVADIPASQSKIVNLTDLANRYGSDKGSDKHRYTELYHMLFLPFRQRKISFLEMGLLIGGPEHGVDKDRETRDLPSVRMWLDYFPKAQIHGLDVSDFAWFEHDRFTFHRCDMDSREELRGTVQDMPQFDIIIDDASHASHHQQNAFLELFPRLAPGGLYIIEDLRWQPKTYEKTGITKTSELFQSYIHDRSFAHSDARVTESFNALRGEISGCFMHQVRFQKERKDQVVVVHKR